MNAKDKQSLREEIREGVEEASRRRKARLLVIEDDSDIREALQLLLAGKYELVGLSHGARIIEMIDGYEPDLVILDVTLPGRDGFELCRTIRSSPQHRHLPVMFLTVLRDDASFVRSINANADAYLNKPFEAGELKDTIARLVCSSR